VRTRVRAVHTDGTRARPSPHPHSFLPCTPLYFHLLFSDIGLCGIEQSSPLPALMNGRYVAVGVPITIPLGIVVRVLLSLVFTLVSNLARYVRLRFRYCEAHDRKQLEVVLVAIQTVQWGSPNTTCLTPSLGYPSRSYPPTGSDPSRRCPPGC
jgi:hypothetical protein